MTTLLGFDGLDRCGLGTPWGCGEQVTDPAHILMHGRTPIAAQGVTCGDSGHVMFHAKCSPAVVEPDAVQRWSGTHSGRVRQREGRAA